MTRIVILLSVVCCLAALSACDLKYLSVRDPLRTELDSGAGDVPLGRVFVVDSQRTLHVVTLQLEGDQIRIIQARPIVTGDGGTSASLAALTADPERAFRLAPGGDNLLLQMTSSSRAEVTHVALFARRRCRGAVCVLEIRDYSNWTVAEAGALGLLDGSGGVSCGLDDGVIATCEIRDPAQFARRAGALDRSPLLSTGAAIAYLVPATAQ